MSNLCDKLANILKAKSDWSLLDSEELSSIKDILSNDATFKYCDKIEFIDEENYKYNIHSTKAIKWFEGLKFKGECKILSISLTPELYDPNSMFVIVKDNAAITPALYNPIKFDLYKRIILEFNVDRPQNGVSDNEKALRQELHQLLDKVLDNPDAYRINGIRSIIISGQFEIDE